MSKGDKKLLSLRNDYVFRTIMGNPANGEELKALLMAVLDLPKEEYGELTVVSPYLTKDFEGDKFGILDLRINTRSGKIIHVEIELEPSKGFAERLVYYQSKMIAGQMSEGYNYSKIDRVISIVITNFNLVNGSDKYHNKFMLCDIKSGAMLTDVMEINTLELMKLPAIDDRTVLWSWLKLLAAKEEKEMLELAEKDPYIAKTVVRIKEMSADERERALAENREQQRRDEWARLEYAKESGLKAGEELGLKKGEERGLKKGEERGLKKGEERGLKKGEERGLKKGEERARKDVARVMRKANVDIAVIAEYSGLSFSDIEKL